MSYDHALNWALERHSIYQKRSAGKPKPWTDDKILQQYRFCNVYRTLDTVTSWVHQNWLTPHEQDPDVWFAMCVARFVNWPDTLAELGYPVPWNPKKFVRVLHDRAARGEKVFTGAYMISAGGVVNGMTKAQYLAEKVLGPLWAGHKYMRPHTDGELELWHEAVCAYEGWGSFMAAQVVADFKYAEPFKQVPDWWTFAASGPGSRRGLNRVLNRDTDRPWKELEWRAELAKLREYINGKWPYEKLHAQDVQGILCETDKYLRVKNGEGRPRSLYNGAA